EARAAEADIGKTLDGTGRRQLPTENAATATTTELWGRSYLPAPLSPLISISARASAVASIRVGGGVDRTASNNGDVIEECVCRVGRPVIVVTDEPQRVGMPGYERGVPVCPRAGVRARSRESCGIGPRGDICELR